MSARSKNQHPYLSSELPVHPARTRSRFRQGPVRAAVVDQVPFILFISGLIAGCVGSILAFFIGDALAILILLFLWPGLACLLFAVAEGSVGCEIESE